MLGSTCGRLALGGVALAAIAAEAAAAVGVYYIETYVDSAWAETTGSTNTSHPGAAYGDKWGTTVNPVFLPGTYTFNEESSSAANPQSIVGTGGYATSDAFLDLSINSTGFTLYGGGTAAAQRGADATASSISADLITWVSLNFKIPAGGVPAVMTLNGTARADAGASLFFRIAEVTADEKNTSNLVYINRTTSNSLNYSSSWNDDSYIVNPGSFYVLDLYALPSTTVNATTFGPLSRTSEINITGTFVPVPEPGVVGLFLVTTLCALSRRRVVRDRA